MYGRGAGDNKGQLLAHLAAFRSLRDTEGLPVGIKVLVEGEEEIGSPHLGAAVEAMAPELTADLAIIADAPVHHDGRPVVIFGVRGLLYLEIEIAGARSDLHSGNRGGLAPMPTWDLVHLLSGLRARDGTVLVKGFTNDVRPPTPAEERLLERLPVEPDSLRREMGIEQLPGGADRDPWRALMFTPTMNLAGISAGYAGAGAKTVIPSIARCKIDCRLVPDQDPDRIYDAIRRHVKRALPGARVEKVAAVPPSATDPSDPLARIVVRAVEAATGETPLERPRLGGTTPDFVFTRILETPSVLVPSALRT